MLLWSKLRARYAARTRRNSTYISHKPTARTATVSVATYTRTKLYTKVISCVTRAVYAWPLPEATSTTVVIEFVLPVGKLPSGVSCHVYFNFIHLESR